MIGRKHTGGKGLLSQFAPSSKRLDVKKYLLTLAGLLLPMVSMAQSPFVPYDPDYYFLIERYEIQRKTFSASFHSTMRPYTRKDIAAFVDSVGNSGLELSPVDRFNLAYLLRDNWEWATNPDNDAEKPILKYFYQKKSDMLHKRAEGFDVHVNPILHSVVTADPDAGSFPYISQRGFSIRGSVDEKVGFYIDASDVQLRPMQYVRSTMDDRRYEGARPMFGEGFYKSNDDGSLAFFNARGHINFSLNRYIQARVGHGKFFIGNGYRSLTLSNFSDDFSYININTKVWRLNYTNIWGKLIASNLQLNGRYPVKFLAFRRIGLDVTDNFNIGIYEAIITSRHDSAGNNQLDAAYLNPMIFYRGLEHDLGDSDNAALGIDFKWNIRKGFQLYGQLYVDELKADEYLGGSGTIFNGDGWWGNKQSYQLGFKYINVLGVDNLDFQGELNYVRPYTYTHYSLPAELPHQRFSNYQHFNQPLAHPLGANFAEVIGIARYQPFKRLTLVGKAFYAVRGTDERDERGQTTAFYGESILRDYNDRTEEYGVQVGHGVRVNWLMIDLTATYMIRHNLMLDLKFTHRNYDAEDDTQDLQSNVVNFSVRWNIPQRLFEF